MNLCLFCVEKKGWSDTFATQSSYNQHYKENHEGIIENKGKSLSEAFILISTNPQYDNRLTLIYMRTTSSEHGESLFCTKINMFSPCSKLGVFMCWTGKLMDNLLS